MIDFEQLTYIASEQLLQDPAVTSQTSTERVEKIRTNMADLAPGFFFGFREGEVVHLLTGWHQYVADECSALYTELTKIMPEADSKIVNQDPRLEELNAIRRGIRFAKTKSIAGIPKRRRGQNLLLNALDDSRKSGGLTDS